MTKFTDHVIVPNLFTLLTKFLLLQAVIIETSLIVVINSKYIYGYLAANYLV